MKKRSLFFLLTVLVGLSTVFMGCASTPKEVIQMSFEDWIKAEATSNKHRTEVWDQGTDREKTVEEDYYYLGTLSGPLPKSFVSQCNTWQGEVHYYWFYVRHVTSITPDTYNEIGEWRIFYGEPGKGVYNRRVSPTSVYWTNELYSLLKYFKN